MPLLAIVVLISGTVAGLIASRFRSVHPVVADWLFWASGAVLIFVGILAVLEAMAYPDSLWKDLAFILCLVAFAVAMLIRAYHRPIEEEDRAERGMLLSINAPVSPRVSRSEDASW